MKQMNRWAVWGLMLALGGCSGAADALGFGRNAPDEFAVVDRAPLSMPPDYDLRPPRPGAARPQEIKMPERASQTVFGGAAPSKSFLSADVGSTSNASDSEKALLNAAGTAKADPAIRETIDRESAQKVTGSEKVIEDLLWWRSPSGDATTVDAKAEAERLREAKEKGEAPNSGATPVIEKRQGGWLGL